MASSLFHIRSTSPLPPHPQPPFIHALLVPHELNSQHYYRVPSPLPDSAPTPTLPTRVAWTPSTPFSELHRALRPRPLNASPVLTPARVLSPAGSSISVDDLLSPSRQLSASWCASPPPSSPRIAPTPPMLPALPPTPSSASRSKPPSPRLQPPSSPAQSPGRASSLLLGVPFHHRTASHSWLDKNQHEQDQQDWLQYERDNQKVPEHELHQREEDELQSALRAKRDAPAWPQEKKDEHIGLPAVAAVKPVPPPLPSRPPVPPRPKLRLLHPLTIATPPLQPSPPPSPGLSPLGPLPLSSYSLPGPAHLFPPLPSIPTWSSQRSVSLIHRAGSSIPPLLIETVHPSAALSAAPTPPHLPHLSLHPQLSVAGVPRSYLRLLLPSLSPSQSEHSLCCRQKQFERKWRFSMSPDRLTKRGNDAYAGKLKLRDVSERSTLYAYDVSDDKSELVAHVVLEPTAQHQWSVWAEVLSGDDNDVEPGRAGRIMVGGETVSAEDGRRLLCMRVEASDRTVLICDDVMHSGSGSSADARPRFLTVDYPVTVFVGFAVVCAVEFSRGMDRDRERAHGMLAL